MNLTLEVVEVIDPLEEPVQTGGERRVFEAHGGTIGRRADNSWVLPAASVSSHHARITCQDGVFSIEDTSLNGVFINSAEDPLGSGRSHVLASGDHIVIGPYKIRVSIVSLAVPDDDPFAPLGDRPPPLPSDRPADLILAQGARPGEEADPLKALNLDLAPRPDRGGPSVDDLKRGSPLDDHYTPPAPRGLAEPAVPPAEGGWIPDSYDPLAPDDSSRRPVLGSPVSEPATPVKSHAPPPESAPEPAPSRKSWAAPQKGSAPSPPGPRAANPKGGVSDDSGLAAVLAGAGLGDVEVTPELARDFGRILRVVVSGVMDVLRARQHVKDEFKMEQTRLGSLANNPLKFSVDADDALYNLLVRRSAAYLAPVEAFEDAFDGLRDHQMAVLEGMQAAFQSMLADFHPDRLEEEFDRQLKTTALLRRLNKFRYWSLYRDRLQAMTEDPERSFRTLFGERFAQAFDEQLERLKKQRRQRNAADPSEHSPGGPRAR